MGTTAGGEAGCTALQRSPSWDSFSRAVREAAATFENKLAELYLRFGQEMESEGEFGSLESELMLGLGEAAAAWGNRASWEEDTVASDLGEQLGASTRWGAVSALSERVGAGGKEDGSPLPSRRNRPTSPPPLTSLTRTASVKETARERSEYLLHPYTSMMGRRGSRSPMRKRRGHGGDDLPPTGATRSQYFTFQPSQPIVPLPTSREREMISEVDDEIIDRRKAVRSLKVQNLLMSQPWRRRTVHSSQPYRPVSNYHERRRKGSEFQSRPSDYPVTYYRRSLEELDKVDAARRKPRAENDLAGAVALSKYYKQPKYIKGFKFERFPH